MLRLFCQVWGDSDAEPFPVKIDGGDTVGELKNLIVIEGPSSLKDMRGPDLKLWKWNQSGGVEDLDLGSSNPLNPMKTIEQIFENDPPQPECVHIVIKVPAHEPLVDSKRPLTVVDERERDIKRRKNIAPSTAAQPSQVSKLQDDQNLYFACPRPPHREFSLPLILLDRVFAKFLDDCRDVEPTEKAYECARRLKDSMCQFYCNEHDRAQTCRAILNHAGFAIQATYSGDTRYMTDGHTICNSRPTVILEVKNEVEVTSAEPFFQSLYYYYYFIRDPGLWRNGRSIYPCFIVSLVGAQISFAGVAYTQRVTAEAFGSAVMDFHSSNEAGYYELARKLTALKIAQDALFDRYSNEGPAQTLQDLSIPDIPNIFPYQETFVHLGSRQLQKFTYVKALMANSNALIFQGQTAANQLICLKFVRQYGKDVHIWCANKGFAPELLGFEKLHGGWFMVVMELLDESWRVLNEASVKTESIPELEGKICSAITQLHEYGMVYGDIREMNILVNDKNEFMLIDYDWAGIHGQVTYPRNINLDPILGRPSGICYGALILPEHDIKMVDNLFVFNESSHWIE